MLLFSSCAEKIDTEKIIGQYVMANDTLELFPNKTFKHSFNNYVNSGTWKLNSTNNEIAFENFTFNPKNGYGVWYSRITLTNGKIQLNVNSDIRNGYFSKLSEKEEQTTH